MPTSVPDVPCPRLSRLAQQARAREEARAVEEGLAETVALSRARGAAIIEGSAAHRRLRRQPYRRLAGLAWLARKGRLTAGQLQAGERYGAVYRIAHQQPAIRSTLDDRGADPAGPSLKAVLAHGESVAQAHRALVALRLRLGRQPDLVAACDRICGEEQTPREAAGGEREALQLEAVLRVALDLLAA